MSAAVYKDLVGQSEAVSLIQRAVNSARGLDSSDAMTHAWLFTGPPGSGRSNAARAFAAALLCDSVGCATCESCRNVYSGTHADLELLDSEGLSIKVDQVRELVTRATWMPSVGGFRSEEHTSELQSH